eukprot:COSAG02_NODE_3463_length_6697_cov_37.140497_2_plen_53_part_00
MIGRSHAYSKSTKQPGHVERGARHHPATEEYRRIGGLLVVHILHVNTDFDVN